MPDEIMLIVEHASGVSYQNQVAGVACLHVELEGVLSPLDVGPEIAQKIQAGPYPAGHVGISAETADDLDAALASGPGTRFIKVDRARMDQSSEAWVHVVVDSPETDVPSLSGPYFGPIYGFGAGRGVLTWPNSD